MPSDLRLTARQDDIIARARRDGRVDVDGLAVLFNVTPQTIRKDLNDLCEAGRLERVHGGAVYPSGTVNLAWQARRGIAAEAKSAIARQVAEMIPDGASLFLNIGTTTEAVAEALLRHEGLMVITNNLNVATLLSAAPGIELMLAGGTVRKEDGGIVGAATVDFIRQFKADFAIIGTSAIDEDGTLLDYDDREVRVTQAIIAQSRNRILVADSGKFERTAPVRIGPFESIDTFVTDAEPPAAIGQLCARHEINLVIANPET